MLSDQGSPYVGRFACGWHRLPGNDLPGNHRPGREPEPSIASGHRAGIARAAVSTPTSAAPPRGSVAAHAAGRGPRREDVVDQQHPRRRRPPGATGTRPSIASAGDAAPSAGLRSRRVVSAEERCDRRDQAIARPRPRAPRPGRSRPVRRPEPRAGTHVTASADNTFSEPSRPRARPRHPAIPRTSAGESPSARVRRRRTARARRERRRRTAMQRTSRRPSVGFRTERTRRRRSEERSTGTRSAERPRASSAPAHRGGKNRIERRSRARRER